MPVTRRDRVENLDPQACEAEAEEPRVITPEAADSIKLPMEIMVSEVTEKSMAKEESSKKDS